MRDTLRCVWSVYWEGLDFDGSDVWVFEVGGDILSAHRTKEEAMDAMNAWKENQHDS